MSTPEKKKTKAKRGGNTERRIRVLDGKKLQAVIHRRKMYEKADKAILKKGSMTHKCYECQYYESLRKGSFLCNNQREAYARMKICPVLRSKRTHGWACNEFVSTPGAKEERRKREEHAKKDRKSLGSYYKEGKNKAMPTMSIAEYLEQQKKGS